MKNTLLTGLFVIGAGMTASAQTLFTYGGKPVSKTEFLRAYEKNALNKRPDLSEKALRDYLNLYILFRMKVAEANQQQLDTSAALRRELENYRRQLSKNYLTDPSATEKLVKEAYERMKTEVQVAHILLPFGEKGDTTRVAKQADSIYNAIHRKKASFEDMAVKYSTDKASRERKGMLGYITGMQTVYPFENRAYNTPVGSVSKPFRSQFGYHILKVTDKRPAQGEVEVAQIMAISPKNRGAEGLAAAHRTIDSAIADLKKGMSWKDAVAKYSQDKFSKDEEGKLKPFGIGRISPEFESAAFALKTPGDLSPAIETDFGVHLIRLIAKHPLKPFDSLKGELRRKVENDSRGELVKAQYLAQVKQKYNWKEYPSAFDALLAAYRKNVMDTGKNAYQFRAADYRNFTAPLLSLNGVNYTGADMMQHAERTTGGRMMGAADLVMRDLYNSYSNTVLQDFQLQMLEKENAEFRNLMQEYHDGILIFDLMDRNVWTRASKDSAGLQQFYNAHKDHYKWEAGFEGIVYRFTNKNAADEAREMLRTGFDSSKNAAILTKLNPYGAPAQVSVVQHGKMEWSRFPDFTRADFDTKGISPVKTNPDGSFTVAYKKREFAAGETKTLAEARGFAVAEYQDYLEKTWHEQLRSKYPVTVEEKVFRSMVQ